MIVVFVSVMVKGIDSDGLCDDVDDCVGFYDCNGSCADLSYLSWVADGFLRNRIW